MAVIWDEKCFADFTQHNLCDMTIMFRKGDTHVIQPFPIHTLCNINAGQNGQPIFEKKRKFQFFSVWVFDFHPNSPKINRDLEERGNLTWDQRYKIFDWLICGTWYTSRWYTQASKYLKLEKFGRDDTLFQASSQNSYILVYHLSLKNVYFPL